jgi:uncharacterized protein
MRWRGGRQSTNVEDRRGIGGGGLAVGGGLGAVVITIIALLFGVDPSALLDQTGGGGPAPATETRPAPGGRQDEMGEFVRVVLATTEDAWTDIFRRNGQQYPAPTLQLFEGQTRSACGAATASVGPFYCPADRKVYIDLSFYRELQTRFRAPGDFAQAYVIAHEVGHHVQNVLGTMDRVGAAQRRMSQAEANGLSVRLELQADCYSGVWARYADQKGVVEPGDIDEALNAASAIGDDRLQRQQQGYVVPDSFTHGTSAQRARWFREGFESGDVRRCDTFAARSL